MLRWRLDDPVNAVAVHLVGGVWSVMGAALFADPVLIQRVYNLPTRPTDYGLFIGGGGMYLATALIATLVVCAFAGLGSYIIFKGLFLLDARYQFRWFFLRSSYHPENVGFGDEDIQDVTGLGIADVTATQTEPRGRRGSLFLFTQKPADPITASVSPPLTPSTMSLQARDRGARDSDIEMQTAFNSSKVKL